MEYLDMVRQIVAAEHNAKTLAEEGRRQQEQLQAGLEGEIDRLRADYMERARRRVELVEQTERAGAEETIARLDEKQRQAMKRVETVYEQNREAWADTLFSLIVGERP